MQKINPKQKNSSVKFHAETKRSRAIASMTVNDEKIGFTFMCIQRYPIYCTWNTNGPSSLWFPLVLGFSMLDSNELFRFYYFRLFCVACVCVSVCMCVCLIKSNRQVGY